MLLVCVADWAQRSTPYDVVDTPADKTTVERPVSYTHLTLPTICSV